MVDPGLSGVWLVFSLEGNEVNFIFDLFSFKGRFNRIQYASALLVGYIIPFGIFLATESWVRANGLDFITLVLLGIMFWVLFASLAKRMHDINKSGWVSLSIIIPLIGQLIPFVMLAYPGDKMENDFGQPSI